MEHLRFHDTPPTTTDGARRWRIRSQNLVVDYIETDTPAVLPYLGGPDEERVLLPDAIGALIEAQGRRTEIPGETPTLVPPGPLTLTLIEAGRAVVLSAARTEDPIDDAVGAAARTHRNPRLAPFAPWPTPDGGYRMRTHRLHEDAPGANPFRVFRSSAFTVNCLAPWVGPRDTTRMFPHNHDDFEQIALVLDGEYVHRLRWP